MNTLTLTDQALFEAAWDAFCKDEKIGMLGKFPLINLLLTSGIPFLSLQNELEGCILKVEMDASHISLSISGKGVRQLIILIESTTLLQIEGIKGKNVAAFIKDFGLSASDSAFIT